MWCVGFESAESNSPVAVVDEGDVAALADDEVIEDADSYEVSDFAQPSCDLEVLSRRSEIAARVVVDERAWLGSDLGNIVKLWGSTAIARQFKR